RLIGREETVRLAALDHELRGAVLRRAGRVVAFELGVEPDARPRAEGRHLDQRRVADGVDDVGVNAPGRLADAHRAPPATAGRIEITSPSSSGVSSWPRKRMSSSLR